MVSAGPGSRPAAGAQKPRGAARPFHGPTAHRRCGQYLLGLAEADWLAMVRSRSGQPAPATAPATGGRLGAATSSAGAGSVPACSASRIRAEYPVRSPAAGVGNVAGTASQFRRAAAPFGPPGRRQGCARTYAPQSGATTSRRGTGPPPAAARSRYRQPATPSVAARMRYPPHRPWTGSRGDTPISPAIDMVSRNIRKT